MKPHTGWSCMLRPLCLFPCADRGQASYHRVWEYQHPGCQRARCRGPSTLTVQPKAPTLLCLAPLHPPHGPAALHFLCNKRKMAYTAYAARLLGRPPPQGVRKFMQRTLQLGDWVMVGKTQYAHLGAMPCLSRSKAAASRVQAARGRQRKARRCCTALSSSSQRYHILVLRHPCKTC